MMIRWLVMSVCCLSLTSGLTAQSFAPKLLKTLGTDRFRFAGTIEKLTVSPNGKLLGVHGIDSAAVFDLATGQRVWTAPRQVELFSGVFSAGFDSQNQFAICTHYDEDSPRLGYFVGDRRMPQHSTKLELENLGDQVTFSPNGRLLVSVDDEITILDTRTGKQLNKIPFDKNDPCSKATFSGSGNRLLVKTLNDRLFVFDCVTGAKLFDQNFGKPFESDTISHDGEELTVQFDVDTLRVFDLKTGKSKTHQMHNTTDIHDVVMALDRGRLLTVNLGDAYFQTLDTRTGKLLRRFRGVESLEHFVLTPDQKTVIASTLDGRIFQWDLASGRRLPVSAEDRELSEVRFFGNDAVGGYMIPFQFRSGVQLDGTQSQGQYTTNTQVELHHLSSGRTRVIRGGSGENTFIQPMCALSSDGSRAAQFRFLPNSPTAKNAFGIESRLELLDTVSGRPIRHIPWRDELFSANTLWFKDDDREVGMYGNNTVYLWNLRTNRVTKLPLRVGADAGLGSVNSVTTSGKWFAEMLSDEQKKICEYRIYDLSRNRLAFRLPLNPTSVGTFRFTPDGSKIIRTSSTPPAKEGDQPNPLEVYVYDSATGRILRRFATDHNEIQAVSPDGRTMVEWGFQILFLDDTEHVLNVIELATGKPRWVLECPNNVYPRSVAFSPDGKRLVTTTSDGLTKVWSLHPHAERAVPKSVELDTLWFELANSDAPRGFAAMQTFSQFPEVSLPFLAKKLPPEDAIHENQLRTWLDDLDSPRFRDRERATRELSRTLPRVRTAVEKTLAKTASVEVRSRLEDLLQFSTKPNGLELQRIRSVEVVEQIVRNSQRGSTIRENAIALLKRWASGAVGSTLTTEARETLDRVNR